MKLTELCARLVALPADPRAIACDVHAIADDSRRVVPGTLFVARTLLRPSGCRAAEPVL